MRATTQTKHAILACMRASKKTRAPDLLRQKSVGCAFCSRPWGTVRKSKEHVLAEWFQKHVGELPANRRHHKAGFGPSADGTAFSEFPAITTIRNSSVLKVFTRKVCIDCNTRWLSTLEDAAKPIIL